MNVHVLVCFVTKSWLREDERSEASAFRVCAVAKDQEMLFRPDTVRNWTFKKQNNGSQA
jgi:hypothetical protein